MWCCDFSTTTPLTWMRASLVRRPAQIVQHSNTLVGKLRCGSTLVFGENLAIAFSGKFEMKRTKDMEYIKSIGSDSCFRNTYARCVQCAYAVHHLKANFRWLYYVYDLLMFTPETDATKCI